MPSFLRGADRVPPVTTLPLFPLKTVLFPGGLLPLRVFEQRYIEMTKRCLKDDAPFGVCLLTRGEEVAGRSKGTASPEFAPIGTLARIVGWDMPQLGILQVKAEGTTRFHIHSHRVADDGLFVAEADTLPAEPATALSEEFQPLAALLELMMNRVGHENFLAERATGDASWVGYRLVELLPLPLSIKQNMLEINAPEVRLKVLKEVLKQQDLI